MLLRLELPKQKHGTHKDADFLEVDSKTTIIVSVVGVEKSEYNTNYHLNNQRLVCTNLPPEKFIGIVLRQSNTTKNWKLDVKFKCSDPKNRDADPSNESASLDVVNVKEVSSFFEID